MSALQIQQDREQADLANHRERLEWLSGESPRWACGELVDTYTSKVLLNQSRSYIRAHSERAAAQKGGA